MEQSSPTKEAFGGAVRDYVASQVNDCLWLDDLKKTYSDIGKGGGGTVSGARCIVCSLPVGTCKHNTKWLDKMAPWSRDLLGDESVDDNMNQMMDVLDQGSVVGSTAVAIDFDFTNIRWCQHVPRLADVIGSERVQVSFPGYRGFHTACVVGDVVVVFGGLQYKSKGIPQPFTSSVRPGDVRCLSDVYIYHVVKASWHIVRCDVHPDARYGHVSAAVDSDTMITYGGRNQIGKFLSDTWLFKVSTCTWTRLLEDELSPSPPARAFSAMCSLNNNSSFLFGGTDGSQNFGDAWIFRGAGDMRWERGVTAGLPPQPRYGHTLSVVREDTSSNSGLLLLVMGGCTVNPISEISAASEGPLGTSLESQAHAKQLAFLNKSLQEAYTAEGKMSFLSGQVLADNIEMRSILDSREGIDVPIRLRSTYQEAARAAARVAALEAESRELENKLLRSWYESQAMQDYNKRTARHPHKNVDTFVLAVNDMVWLQQKKKSITGTRPPARMLATAAVMGDRYVMVVGGALPTAIGYKPVDKEHTALYVFDAHELKWSTCFTTASKEAMSEPMHMAEMEISRARQRVDLEHRRGMMLGAPNGLTTELMEARRMLEVSMWRKEMLLKELDSMIAPPPPRWGATSVPIGQRLLLYGGWTDRQAAGESDTLVLDAENNLERLRRMEDEFQARIEIERVENEERGRGFDLQSAYELRMLLAAEREREQNERRQMGICDILSKLPELTRPPPVRFVKSNEHTIWVEWDPVFKDAYGKPVYNVEYVLLISGGYIHLGVGDRVEVKPSAEFLKSMKARAVAEAEMRRAAKKKTGMAALEAAIKEAEKNARRRNRAKRVEEPEVDIPFFKGEIVHSRVEGTFDIRYDDGSLETRVKRDRITLELNHPDPSTLSHKAAERLRENLRKKEELKMKEMSSTSMLSMAAIDLCSPSESSASVRPPVVTPLDTEMCADYNGTRKKTQFYLDDLFDILPLPAPNKNDIRLNEEFPSPANDRKSQCDDEAQPLMSGQPVKAPHHLATVVGSSSSSKMLNKTFSTGIPSGWTVVYRGSELSHICSGLVPLEVIDNEPHVVVTIKVALVTIGTDYPDNALSQMSAPTECSTRRTRIWDTTAEENSSQASHLDFDDDLSSVQSGVFQGNPSKSLPLSVQISPDKRNLGGNSPEKRPEGASITLMSKKKKDIITAVLDGNRAVELERKKNVIQSSGVFDHFE